MPGRSAEVQAAGPSTPQAGDMVPTSPSKEFNGVVLEDFMFKQGSRSKNFWHERYFVLNVDGTLRYYNKKEDTKPKARLELNQVPGCEVGDIFVAKHKSQLLYCVQITWAVLSDDDDSVFSVPTVTMNNEELEQPNDTGAVTTAAMAGEENNDTGRKSKKGNIFRKISKRRSASLSNVNNNAAQPGLSVNTSREEPVRYSGNASTSQILTPRSPVKSYKQKEKVIHRPTTPGYRSIDGESLTVGTRRPTLPSLPPPTNAADSDEIPRIPAMVEVQEETADAENTTVRARNSSSRHVKAQDDQNDNEMEYLRTQYLAEEKEKKKLNKRKVAEGAKYAAAASAAAAVAVVTVGIGLVAGLVVLGVGAAAGASGTATGAVWKKKRDGVIVLGTPDYDKIRRWKTCLDASLASNMIQKSKWGQVFAGCGNNKRRVLIFPKSSDNNRFIGANPAGDLPSPDAAGGRDTAGAMFSERTASAKWRPLEGGWTSFLGTGPQGLRIFREELPAANRRHILRNLSIDGQPCPAMKAHVVLNATPLDAFLCLMSQGQLPPGTETGATLTPNSGQRASFRIIESIDDNTDVIHMVCNPLFLFPSWTTPRDFVLYRYWRLEEDGNFIVCFESVQHKDCPPHPGFCRGVMHQVFTLSPNKKHQRRKAGGTSSKDQAQECLMTAVVQVDPKGWIPIAPLSLFSNQGYGDAFAVAALIQLLDIRDAIDQDRFIPVSLDDNLPFPVRSVSVADQALPAGTANIPHINSMGSDGDYHEHLVNYDFAFSNRETNRARDSPTGLTTTPPPLPPERWAEPDANSFCVRGRTYKEDRKKINAGASIGRLVAVDVVQVEKPIYSGLTVHPKERLQLALKKEKQLKEKGEESDLPPFLFVVNIILPGPPFYHGVFYYAIDDMSTIDGSDGSPSSLLCQKFLFGDSDTFRDKTFKLIPQIVEGNFIVRRAVGSTPAIMGKKLKQTYVRTERSFEVVLDCGSSPVATGVIRLSLGYAKTLVVDMGFLIEGDDDVYLPERLMGCARIRSLEFGSILRKIEHTSKADSTKSTSDKDTSDSA